MASVTNLSYGKRAALHSHPLAKRILEIAETKKTNLVISADLTTTKDLLHCAETLGPYIAAFKTHIDIVSDFGDETVSGLQALALKHNFLIFEDRKFIDIGHTVQKQYDGGALQISEFAHIVNISLLSGEDVVTALSQVVRDPKFPYPGERAFLLLAEMTTKGSLATGVYTQKCIEAARANPDTVVGFVATTIAETIAKTQTETTPEDFLIFTTGINQASKGDALGQQYKSPASAIAAGTDFIIAGRGIYAAKDPMEAARSYLAESWEAYVKRIS